MALVKPILAKIARIWAAVKAGAAMVNGDDGGDDDFDVVWATEEKRKVMDNRESKIWSSRENPQT